MTNGRRVVFGTCLGKLKYGWLNRPKLGRWSCGCDPDVQILCRSLLSKRCCIDGPLACFLLSSTCWESCYSLMGYCVCMCGYNFNTRGVPDDFPWLLLARLQLRQSTQDTVEVLPRGGIRPTCFSFIPHVYTRR